MSIDPNDLLLGGGVPSAKFPTVGTLVKGVVEHSEVTQQTDLDGNKKTWDNGDPRLQVVISLQTDECDASIEDDNGVRKLYVKGQMQKALGEALRQAKAKLEVGGLLAVQYKEDQASEKRGHNPTKIYVCQYQAPALAATNDLLGAAGMTAPTAGVAADDLLG